jgi:glucuronosyltransferase
MDRAMGSLTPYSFVPHLVLYNYDDKMTFFQRSYNFLFSMFDVLYRRFSYLPQMEVMAKEHFSLLDGPLPSVTDLEKSISMILVNSHFSMISPRPLMPGMVNIAGAHVKPSKALPSDLKEFLDNAEHGVIYMSLGAFVQSSMMPKETMTTILKVFGSLKQRVLWKFESDNLPKLPPNVMVRKWMPQPDILAHQRLRLFISHGGLFGTIEASVRGVPVLFMPFYGDQYKNAKQAEDFGYAQKILFSEINEKSFKSKINEIINNKKYELKAKEISKLMNDNPVQPMDEAIYWIEYCVRFNGAAHLKSPAVNLPWYKYLSFDVFVFFLLASVFIVKALKALLSLIFGKKKSPAGHLKKTD